MAKPHAEHVVCRSDETGVLLSPKGGPACPLSLAPTPAGAWTSKQTSWQPAQLLRGPLISQKLGQASQAREARAPGRGWAGTAGECGVCVPLGGGGLTLSSGPAWHSLPCASFPAWFLAWPRSKGCAGTWSAQAASDVLGGKALPVCPARELLLSGALPALPARLTSVCPSCTPSISHRRRLLGFSVSSLHRWADGSATTSHEKPTKAAC